jgi:polygalacturonase
MVQRTMQPRDVQLASVTAWQANNNIGRINVRDHGAVGDGVANDTAALQAAIDAVPAAGGTVYLPTGQYNVTDKLTLRSNLTLLGDGDGASLIQQTTTNKDLLAGSALNRVVIEKLYLGGTGSGTGTGVNLTKGANDAVPYISMRDVTVDAFGQDGISVENPIVSLFARVASQNNGRYGVNLYGQIGGAAGTSTTLTAVYGNANGTAGLRLYNMVYATAAGCAADHNPIGYLIDGCQSITVTGSGAEGNTASGVKVNGGYGVTLAGMWQYDNKGVGIHVTGSAHTVSLISATDNTPNASATNFIKVDSGSFATLLGCNNTTANSLAAGSTNVVGDAGGGVQFQGYAAILGGGEFDSDLTCYVAAKGIVLTDRSNAGLYRLKVTGGTLGVEVVS